MVRPEGDFFWIPDVIFVNEKESLKSLIFRAARTDSVMQFSESGEVTYSARLSLVLFCPMDFSRFPFDTQMCPVRLSTFLSRKYEVMLRWKSDSPVRVLQPAYITTQFRLKKVDPTTCKIMSSATLQDDHSCLEAVLELERPCNYYLMIVYTPSTMLVIAAWLSCWLDRYLRFGLLVVSLSIMTAQVAFLNASLPMASYTRAIDVWTGVCVTFVFSALVEFVLLEYTCRRNSHIAKTAGKEDRPQSPCSQRTCAVCAPGTDRAFRNAFPVLFAAFALLYWLSYALV